MSLRKTAASKYDSSLDSSLANEVADELVRPILNQNNLDDSMIIQALESLTAQYEDKQAKKASKKVSFDISSKIDGVSGNPDKVSAFIKELYAILASTGKAAFNINFNAIVNAASLDIALADVRIALSECISNKNMLEGELETARSARTKALQEAANYRASSDSLHSLQQIRQETTNHLKSNANLSENMEKQVRSFKSLVLQLQDAVGKLENMSTVLGDSKIGNENKSLAAMHSLLQSIAGQVGTEAALADSLASIIEGLTQTKSAQESTITSLSNAVQEEIEKTRLARIEVSQVQSELSQAQDQANRAKSEYEAGMKRLGTLNGLLMSRSSELSLAQERVLELEAALKSSAAAAAIEAMRKKNIPAIPSMIPQISLQESELRTTIAQKNAEIESLKSKYAQLVMKQGQDFGVQSGGMVADAAAHESILKECNDLRSKLNESVNALNDLKREKTLILSTYCRLLKQTDSLTAELTALKSKQGVYSESQWMVVQDQLNALKKDLATVQQSSASSSDFLTSPDASELEKQMAALKNQNKKLQDQLIDAMKARSALLERMQALSIAEVTVSRLQEQLAATNAEIEIIRNRVELLDAQNNQLSREVQIQKDRAEVAEMQMKHHQFNATSPTNASPPKLPYETPAAPHRTGPHAGVPDTFAGRKSMNLRFDNKSSVNADQTPSSSESSTSTDEILRMIADLDSKNRLTRHEIEQLQKQLDLSSFDTPGTTAPYISRPPALPITSTAERVSALRKQAEVDKEDIQPVFYNAQGTPLSASQFRRSGLDNLSSPTKSSPEIQKMKDSLARENESLMQAMNEIRTLLHRAKKTSPTYQRVNPDSPATTFGTATITRPKL